MFRKASIIALLLVAVSVSSYLPSYSVGSDSAIEPPADTPDDLTNGTTRQIINAEPGNWKETEMYSDAYGGIFSNQLLYDSSQYKYIAQIYLDAPLTSGTDTIPLTYNGKPTLQYILTYNYAYYGSGDPRNGPAQGIKVPVKYRPFQTSPEDIYTSTTFEAPAFPTVVQMKHQFKYAIQAPDNQPSGTYSGTIRYRILKESDRSLIGVERTCPITVQVINVFKLSIDRGAIDFEKMAKGETKENVPVEGIIIASETNYGNPWYLKISNDNPLSNGPYVIPNSNFIWYGWTDGEGTWYGNGKDEMSLSPMLMYSSSVSEGFTPSGGVKNHLKFKLTIPKAQPGGKYLTTVRLTFTE